jgi:hypothetical protein
MCPVITPPPPRKMTHAQTAAWCRRDPTAAADYALCLFMALSAEDRASALEEIEDMRLRAELSASASSAAARQ